MSNEIEQYQDRSAVALSTSQDVAVQRLGEWAQSAQAAYHVAENLVRTSFVPEGFRGKPHEATAAILSGLEVGLSPMAALRSFDVIQGTAAPRAITLRAIVQSHGHDVELIESNASRCVMEGTRRGSSKAQRVVWTLDRAKQLGLTGKANWKNQPQAMLLARATSEVCRLIAADAILGIAYTAEEIADGGTGEQATAAATTDAAPNGTRRMSRPARPEVNPFVADGTDAVRQIEESEEHVPEEPITAAQLKKLHTMLTKVGITDREDGLAYYASVLDRQVESSKDLTKAEAIRVIDALERIEQGENADAEIVEEYDPTTEPGFGGTQ